MSIGQFVFIHGEDVDLVAVVGGLVEKQDDHLGWDVFLFDSTRLMSYVMDLMYMLIFNPVALPPSPLSII